ncbi:sigma 54-interacting transcriptional regulator [bacterium]|nr:sigma 54-interacting transcriptional regulator [bacterium]
MENAFSIKGYRLVRRLSETSISESWLAENERSGERCFLKVSRLDAQIGGEEAAQFLYRSIDLQRDIRTPMIVTATRRGFDGGRQFAEYPYLDTNRWLPLTGEIFWRHFPQSLLGACSAVDYLHACDLVHCDLKLSNFLVSVEPGAFEVRLVDLDFLVPHRTDLEKIILGTYEYMAPEIEAGEPVRTESDNYSMGMLLRRCLESAPSSLDKSEEMIALAERLSKSDPLDRPLNILSAIERTGVLGSDTVRAAEKELFRALIASRFIRERERLSRGTLTASTFFERERILGLPDELLSAFNAAQVGSPLAVMHAFQRFVAASEIQRLANTWYIKADDNAFRAVYTALDSVSDAEDVMPSRSDRPVAVEQALSSARRLRAAGKPHRGLLHLQTVLARAETSESSPADTQIAAFTEAAELSMLVSRFQDALEYYRRTAPLLDEGSEESYLAYRAMVQILATIGSPREALELAQKCLASPHIGKHLAWGIEFRRMKAFLDGALGRTGVSVESLQKLIEEAEELRDLPLLARLYSNLGSTYHRRGDYVGARRAKLTAIAIARRAGYTDGLFVAFTIMAGHWTDVAAYRKAVQYSERALRLTPSPLTRLFVGEVYLTLVGPCARMTEYEAGDHYLSRYLAATVLNFSPRTLASYFGTRGFLLLQQGKLREAEEALRLHFDFSLEHATPRARVKALTNSCTLALFRGDLTRCRTHTSRAIELAREIGDHASEEEAASVQFLSELEDRRVGDPGELLACLGELVRLDSHAIATQLLLMIMLYGGRELARQALSIVEPVDSLLRSSQEPTMRAVSLIRKLYDKPPDSGRDLIPDFKAAYNILLSAGRRYFAMQVCRFIGDLYAEAAETKVAYKFFLQARQIAEGMDNKRFIASVSKDMEKTSERETVSAGRLQAFISVSNILRKIDDYDHALREIVRFAATETGAERGVLLLRYGRSDDFRVKTSYNCDLESLKDISDFSRSIPAFVAAQKSPLLIEDATRDEMTRDYKSIITHNIRSVLCVPVWSEEDLVGALYLDHHTIPAMFDESDFEFVSALSNFLTVILEAVEKVRTVNLKAKQLSEDLVRSGVASNIITRSPRIMQLIDGMETFARTGSPLLFLGESGTGKELFCDLAHRLSRRADNPFIKLNCAAVTESMLEGELFGVENRAVTGVDAREGRFELADGGTLLLDEIGEMSKKMQAKVLRVIEHGEFERVGGGRTRYCDVRLICSTNRDLDKMVAAGEFRLDLLHRINKLTMILPPLRERPEDIPELIHHFMEKYSPTPSQTPKFSEAVIDLFMSYSWPGNIRELRNVVERCCIIRPGARVRIEDLPPNFQTYQRPGIQSESVPNRKVMLEALDASRWDVAAASLRTGISQQDFRSLDEWQERERIRAELAAHKGNISRAARATDIKLTTFRRRMRRYFLL